MAFKELGILQVPERSRMLRELGLLREKLPASLAHGLKLDTEIVEERAPLQSVLPAEEQVAQGAPVDHAIRWGLGAGEIGKRGQQIKDGSRLAGHGSRCNLARPTKDAGLTHAAFVRVALPAAQRPGATAAATFSPAPASSRRAVVRREDDQSIVVEVELSQGLDELPHAPIDFLDGVGVETVGRAALEVLGSVLRVVRKGVGKVKKEGAVAILADKPDRPLGVASCQSVLVDRGFESPVVLQ